ncbi:hypothetical protein [Mesorhizobium sp. CA5]|uniref:hypothetical protein n=1 Tax=Mesorhizobium sp. CA5 TaxID=2876638 RepID=UPI001CD08AF1|nr:hypothetical protein [Mesorhizobium sp. CA5]MBZ9842876.1 hypothetical protein [Mesorhizobium sp. CA5]
MHLQFAYALAGALFCSMPVAANACQAGDARLAGHYYLNGVMEVGSELLLKKDGSFEFALAYGANDQYGKGCWCGRARLSRSSRQAAAPPPRIIRPTTAASADWC